MERIWNYFFYCVWRFLNVTGQIFIVKPIINIMTKIHFFRKNWERGKNFHDHFVYNRVGGIDIGFAFSHLFIATLVIYTCICAYFIAWLNIKIGRNNDYYYFIAILTSAFFTNQLLLYKADKYLTYFKEFDRLYEANRKKIYWHAILFYISVVLFAVICFLLYPATTK